MLILEINELNCDAKSLEKLPIFFKKLKDFNCKFINTKPDSDIEYEGLDPWVQWPTIHNRCEVLKHGQLRHGDSINKSFKPDIFNLLLNKKYKVNAWGIMNLQILCELVICFYLILGHMN